MKQIKLIRVDDRLIHAQIILFWIKKLNINTIYIIDDQLYQNDFLKKIYQLTTPPHIRLKIFSIKEAISQKNFIHNISSQRILILIKDLGIAVSLHSMGFPIAELQIGGGLLESGINKNQIIDYLLSEHHKEISYLFEHNITIYCQKSIESEKIFIFKEKK